MSFTRSERKWLEILRILSETTEPMGAKRLSELMAERGFVLSDRAVQYYLSELDDMGFTWKVGNKGRLLTPSGIAEIECALVEERIGFVISKLERLAFRSTFDPRTGTGDVAYNLSVVADEDVEGVSAAFDEVIERGMGFFSRYGIIDQDPRIPPAHTGLITVCSITMDGVIQKAGVPVNMAYGGRLAVRDGRAEAFADLIGYRGTTVDPLQLFISAGLTSVGSTVATGTGVVLANVRQVPASAQARVEEVIALMRDRGFVFPVTMDTQVFNLRDDPYRLSIVAYSGMNLIANAIEKGFTFRTEIGGGTISYAKLLQ
ncbi:MAG: NrpR regulatory domain-containing protein [Methanomicrobiaceae archaeon]|nr:NrpR regulatory domain-containing protein [Methanomicrobiaceae archaeon]